MEFRPCIDIHNGKVKQIVGGSLADKGDYARENYVSEADAAYFSDLYYINYTKKQHKSKYTIRKIAISHNTEFHFFDPPFIS